MMETIVRGMDPARQLALWAGLCPCCGGWLTPDDACGECAVSWAAEREWVVYERP